MHDPIAKAKKAEQAIQTLIHNAAERLQRKNPNLTIQQARVEIRKNHPEWTELARKVNRSKTKAEQLATRTTENQPQETVKARIDAAIDKKADELAKMPTFYNESKAQRRTRVRQTEDGRTLMNLYRTPQAKRPYQSIKKTSNHQHAVTIIDRWLDLDA